MVNSKVEERLYKVLSSLNFIASVLKKLNDILEPAVIEGLSFILEDIRNSLDQVKKELQGDSP